MDLSEQHTAII